MRISKITLGLFLACLVAASCTRKNDVIYPPDAPIGGKGGKAQLRISPRHHGKNIDTCIIHLAYNATNFSSNPWDETKLVTIIDGKPTVIFDSLTPGNYFVYAEGYDPLVSTFDGPAPVYGSGPFTLLDSNKSYEVFIDVNEQADHVHTPQD